MKTTVRWVLAVAATLATTATASAHHCKGYRMYGAPMMPMMGYGVAPMFPVGFPAVGGAGASMSMSMSLTGDATIMAPPLLQFLGRLLAGVGGALSGTDGAGASRLLSNLSPETARVLMLLLLDDPAVQRKLKAILGTEGAPKTGSAAPVPSPELRRAEQEFQRVLAQMQTKHKEMSTPTGVAKSSDPQAEYQRLMAEIKAKQAAWSTPASTPVAVSSK